MPYAPEELQETYAKRIKACTTTLIKDLDDALEQRYSPGTPFEYHGFSEYQELPEDVKRYITVQYELAGWAVNWDVTTSVTTDQRDGDSYHHKVSKIILTEKPK